MLHCCSALSLHRPLCGCVHVLVCTFVVCSRRSCQSQCGVLPLGCRFRFSSDFFNQTLIFTQNTVTRPSLTPSLLSLCALPPSLNIKMSGLTDHDRQLLMDLIVAVSSFKQTFDKVADLGQQIMSQQGGHQQQPTQYQQVSNVASLEIRWYHMLYHLRLYIWPMWISCNLTESILCRYLDGI